MSRRQVGAAPIAHDPSTLALVDAWTWHTVSAPSAHDFGNASRAWAYGKADFTNEHGARSPPPHPPLLPCVTTCSSAIQSAVAGR
jgi:hypothetical protein